MPSPEAIAAQSVPPCTTSSFPTISRGCGECCCRSEGFGVASEVAAKSNGLHGLRICRRRPPVNVSVLQLLPVLVAVCRDRTWSVSSPTAGLRRKGVRSPTRVVRWPTHRVEVTCSVSRSTAAARFVAGLTNAVVLDKAAWLDSATEILTRMRDRGAERDTPKLRGWHTYQTTVLDNGIRELAHQAVDLVIAN